MPTYYNNISPSESTDEACHSEPAGEHRHAHCPQSPHDGSAAQRKGSTATCRPESVYGDMFSTATRCATAGPWKSLTVRGISNYPPDFEHSVEETMLNYKQVIEEYFRTNSLEKKEQLKELFLHSVLPYMEEILEVCGVASIQMLKMLPFLCSSRDTHVSRYALYLTLHVLSKCTCEVDFIVDIEEQIRNSIVGEGITVFDVQTPEDQGLRVFVYSRALMMFILHIKHGQIRTIIGNKVGNICSLEQKLVSLNKQTPFKEKRCPRYAVACIHKAIKILKEPLKERLYMNFLDWLQRYDQNNVGTVKEREQFLNDFVENVATRHKTGWFDYHVVVFCLQARIHKDPKVVEVLFALVDRYTKVKVSRNPLKRIKWTDEAQWQTGLHLSSILEDVAMKNKVEATRKVACGALCLYSGSLNKNSTYTERLFLEESLEKCCFGPVREASLPMVLTKLEKEDPMTVLSSMRYLESARYRQHMIPRSFKFLKKEEDKGFFKTTFRGEPSVVKILVNSFGEQRNALEKQSKQYHDLLKEAYVLRRLNISPHPNIVRVFAYDTHCKPYHIITEYADNGTLLQFLQDARSDIHPLPKPSMLLQMILGVIDGLMYLLNDDKNLVHQSIMSSSILVSSDRTCKLTGFQALQQMTYNQETGLYEYISKKDKTSIRHAAPEILTDGRYSEKSMVFHCGCVLYEIFTYGCTPYNWIKDDEAEQIRSHVLKEDDHLEDKCIPKIIEDIINECQQFDPYFRPNLTALKRWVDDVQGTFISSPDTDRPSTEYPPLTPQDTKQASPNSCDSLDKLEHDKVLGVFGTPTLAPDRAVVQNFRGIPRIRELVEKTKQEDLKKLRDLTNPFIVKVLSTADYDGKYYALHTEYSERSNLLNLVLKKECTSTDLVRVLVQILSGLIYLHDSNMLHCDLRAENIMVFYDERQTIQAKIARLGRSMLLGASQSAIEFEMPKDAIRRSPPEVIKNNTYSISSDVWSFALMVYELFDAHGQNEQCQPEDVEPIKCEEEVILAYLEGNNRPRKPPSMPDWLYIAVKQGLLHKPEERPPPLLLHDCLTHMKPFESCLLSRWKEVHPDQIQSRQIDVNVEQPYQPAQNHIVPTEQHMSLDTLKGMVAIAVFMEHSYRYIPENEFIEDDNDDAEDLYDDIYESVTSNNTIQRNTIERRVEDVIYDAVEIVDPTAIPLPVAPINQRRQPQTVCPDYQQSPSSSPPLPYKPQNLPPIKPRTTQETAVTTANLPAIQQGTTQEPRALTDIQQRRPAPLPRRPLIPGPSLQASTLQTQHAQTNTHYAATSSSNEHEQSACGGDSPYVNTCFPSEHSEPPSLASIVDGNGEDLHALPRNNEPREMSFNSINSNH